MKGKKAQQPVFNDDAIDTKLKELGSKMKTVKVGAERKSKNFFEGLNDNAKPAKKTEKESAEFKWEVEAYPKKVTKVAEQAPKNPKSKIVEIPAEVVERQTIPVEKSTSPQKKQVKAKYQPQKNSSTQKSIQINNNYRYLKYVLAAIALISGYLLVRKYQRLLFTFEKDYYDMLEVEHSASSADIKAQFKKLAIKFHPDKNKNCGPSCALKFTEINTAYEVIGNEEKRKAYDSTYGTKYIEIPSKSPTLRAAQYNEMVLESDDYWVIQVFSDNDRNSNYLANAWESLYEQLKGSIQMARINFRDRGKFYWLNSMKLSEDNMPLVFSYHKSIGFTLASYDLNRAEVSLKSFIRDNIPSEINFIRAGDVQNMIAQVTKTQRPSVLILSTQSKTPINVLALGLKLKGYVDIYVNAGDQPIPPLQKQLNDTKANVLVMFHNNDQLFFKHYTVAKNQDASDLNAIIQPMLILSQPFIQLDNLRTFCYNKLNIEQDIICILLNGKYATKPFLEEVRAHQMSQYVANLDKSDYQPIQFALVDLEDQQVLHQFLRLVRPNDTVKALVIEAAQQKFQVYTQLEDVEALLDDIKHSEFDYMNYYQPVEHSNELFTNKYQSLMERFTDFVVFKFKQDPMSVFVIGGLEALLFYKIKNPQTKAGACLVLLLSYISYLL